MQIFQCSQCQHTVYFESYSCVHCGATLGFAPDTLRIVAVLPTEQGSDGEPPQAIDPAQPQQQVASLWTAIQPPDSNGIAPKNYKFCRNHTDHHACNFLVEETDTQDYCVSCRQTRVIPNLSEEGNLWRWTLIENAKRRLYYTLARLNLEGGAHAYPGTDTPVYEFKEDVPGEKPVMTGHSNGLITLNIAEADDDERAKRRIDLHEPYRTLLGHIRHEAGHFYWDQLIAKYEPVLEACRAVFGDERADYGEALKQHYENPKQNWQQDYISAYATSHAWEDWAETWAHYLHLMDLVETASSFRINQLDIESSIANPSFIQVQDPFNSDINTDFEAIVRQSVSVSVMLNGLNRSLGQNDAYPFTLSSSVVQKLQFVHDLVHRRLPSQNQDFVQP